MPAQNPWWGKTLRIAGIVLMSLTAVFTLMGGAGTICVALNPTGFGGRFAGIAPFQWLYILFVLVTLALGAWGVQAVVQLIRGRPDSYRRTLIVLAAGIVVGAFHMAASRVLRGSSMPVDMVVYTTVITLAVFLLFRLPSLWQRLGFERPGGGNTKEGRRVAAMALAATGVLTLTVQFLVAPTHTASSVNYADAWRVPLTLVGGALITAGVGAQLRSRVGNPRRARQAESAGTAAGL